MEWRYRVIKRKGSGAFSDVYKAEDLVMTRFVAKKVLRVRDEENLKRFKRDDSMLRKYAWSPYFVDLYDSDINGPHPYLILEYSHFGSLQVFVGKLTDWKKGARWLSDIAQGLELMHSNGDMHRDIKPGNLLPFQYEREIIKFTDFGHGLKADTSGPLTNSVFGTVGYADPEAIRTGIFFPQADIYAAGRTMTALFTGSPERSIFRPLPGPVEFRNLIDLMMDPDITKRPTPRQIHLTVKKLLSTPEPQPAKIDWTSVITASGIALGILAMLKPNHWDEEAGRYRNSKGQFASGWL